MRIIISGGGTGGHVYPAIAIANTLKEKGVEDILFVGANGKLEMEKVPKAGFEIEGLDIRGFHRTRKWRNILFPFKLLGSLWKAKKVFDKFGPDVVVGVGGYASGPILKIAQLKNIPTVLQEQNSYPGVTNKLLAKKAKKICVAYKGMEKYFDVDKIRLTGNPVRKDLENISHLRAEAFAHFDLDPDKRTVSIFGGSLGARSVNAAIACQAEMIRSIKNDVQLLWQVGNIYHKEYSQLDIARENNVRMLPFVDRMDFAYAVSDVVICRAGALTISELLLIGKPSVLVPSPNVAEDHQTKNAEALVEASAALMVKDAVAKRKLVAVALELLEDKSMLESLRKNMLRLARPDARNEIAEEILKIGRSGFS